MADNDSLEAKYGRRKTTESQNNNQSNNTQQETKNDSGFVNKYGDLKNQYGNGENLSQQSQQNIRRNIAETLSEFNSKKFKNNDEYDNVDIPGMSKAEDATPKKETLLVKFLKAVVILLIILVVACTVIAFIMRDKVNLEGAEIIDQINNAEAMYYSFYKRYYYFSKTSYDSTLGIDMSIYKYFNYYEVKNNDETGNYEIKLYGATNAFTITYHTIKAFLNKR
jgi:hypothetical protein